MIDSIQGMQPVLVQVFNELNSDVNNKTKENLQDQLAGSGSNKKEELKPERKNTSDNSQKADFSEYEKKIRSLLGEENLSIEFSLDKDTKRMIMKVIDNETKETVRQYPPEVSLKIARILSNTMETGNVTNVTI